MNRNYYIEMRDGLYYCRFDRMGLFDSSDAVNYIKPRLINNDGEYYEVENDIVTSPISVLTMIEIVSKGYGLEILKAENVKPIFDTVYGHITMCLKAKDDDIYGTYRIPDSDLAKMEDFLVKIYNNNKHLLASTHDLEMVNKLGSVNITNRFSRPVNETTTTKIDSTRIRRVSDQNEIMDIRDLLNTINN